MIGTGLVQIPAGGHRLAALELLVVEPDAEDPFARGHVFGVVVEHLLELLERLGCFQVQLGEAACVGQQIDHFVGKLFGFPIAAAVNKFTVLYNEGRALVTLALHRINSTVHISCRMEHLGSSSFITDVSANYTL